MYGIGAVMMSVDRVVTFFRFEVSRRLDRFMNLIRNPTSPSPKFSELENIADISVFDTLHLT